MGCSSKRGSLFMLLFTLDRALIGPVMRGHLALRFSAAPWKSVRPAVKGIEGLFIKG